jgi:hypothetical protein
MSKELGKNILFFVDVLKVTNENAGSGFGYISQRYGSADLDLYQNFMDPQH